jgi:hypothetical protein
MLVQLASECSCDRGHLSAQVCISQLQDVALIRASRRKSVAMCMVKAVVRVVLSLRVPSPAFSSASHIFNTDEIVLASVLMFNLNTFTFINCLLNLKEVLHHLFVDVRCDSVS